MAFFGVIIIMFIITLLFFIIVGSGGFLIYYGTKLIRHSEKKKIGTILRILGYLILLPPMMSCIIWGIVSLI